MDSIREVQSTRVERASIRLGAKLLKVTNILLHGVNYNSKRFYSTGPWRVN